MRIGRYHGFGVLFGAMAVCMAFPGTGLAFSGSVDPGLFDAAPVSVILEKEKTVFSNFSDKYDRAFRKSLKSRHAFLALYYSDLSTGSGVSHLMSEAERKQEERRLARQALSFALKDTIREVNVLYNIREYGRAMTTADMRVQDGSLDINGPSLKRAGNRQEPSRLESFRSSLVMINNADFGVSLKTRVGSIQSRFTYFLAGADILGASIEKKLTRRSKLVLEYRIAPDESQALVKIQLPTWF